MSRSKGDGRKKHKRIRYDKEDPFIQEQTRRKRRRANKKYADNEGDERHTPNPEKSSGGWFTW